MFFLFLKHLAYLLLFRAHLRANEYGERKCMLFLCNCHSIYLFLLVSSTNRLSRGFTVQSSFKLKLPPHLIIPAAYIKLVEPIGQGEFYTVCDLNAQSTIFVCVLNHFR